MLIATLQSLRNGCAVIARGARLRRTPAWASLQDDDALWLILRDAGQQRSSSGDERNCAHAGMTVVHAAISPRIPAASH